MAHLLLCVIVRVRVCFFFVKLALKESYAGLYKQVYVYRLSERACFRYESYVRRVKRIERERRRVVCSFIRQGKGITASLNIYERTKRYQTETLRKKFYILYIYIRVYHCQFRIFDKFLCGRYKNTDVNIFIQHEWRTFSSLRYIFRIDFRG